MNIIHAINSIPISNNSVIVYDIDDTLIDSFGAPIQPIIDTYHYAKTVGLIPAIITARYGTEFNIKNTIDQLNYFGITDYRMLYMMPTNKNDPAHFKELARKNIHKMGYEIVMSIGDMPWDIGNYGGIGFIV
jgi:predicted secreted acid phosphatase